MCHLPFPCCAAHASAVASSLAAQLAALRHWNGTPVCTLYGAHAAQLAQLQGQVKQQQHPQQQHPQQQHPQQQQQQQQQQQPPRPPPLPPGVAGQGPVVTFNLLRADGSFVGYRCGGGWSAQLPAMLRHDEHVTCSAAGLACMHAWPCCSVLLPLACGRAAALPVRQHAAHPFACRQASIPPLAANHRAGRWSGWPASAASCCAPAAAATRAPAPRPWASQPRVRRQYQYVQTMNPWPLSGGR